MEFSFVSKSIEGEEFPKTKENVIPREKFRFVENSLHMERRLPYLSPPVALVLEPWMEGQFIVSQLFVDQYSYST